MLNMKMACPPGWIDRSMIVMSAPGPARSGVAPNMVVTRDDMPKSLPPAGAARMHAVLDIQVSQMREKLAGFREVSRKVDDEHPVAEILIHWTTPQAPIAQWLTFAEMGDGRLMVATATSGRDEFDDHQPIFRQMLETLTPET